MAKYIGIDITNEFISIYERGEGITLCERNCVCVDIVTRENLAVGNAALNLANNTPGAVELIDNLYTKESMNEELLSVIISELFYQIRVKNPVVIVAVKKDDKPKQIAALANIIFEAGAKEVYTVDMLSACSLGSGIMLSDKRCMMSCNITDEYSVLGIVKGCINKGSKTFLFSFNKLLEVITTFIKNEKNCTVSREDAKSLLEYSLLARPEFEYDGFAYSGIDIITGLPVSGKFASAEIKELLSPFFDYLCENISSLYTHLPPEIKEEVEDKGILLCGNSNLSSMLNSYIEDKTKLHVTISTANENACLMGIGTVIENLNVFEVLLKGIGDEE